MFFLTLCSSFLINIIVLNLLYTSMELSYSDRVRENDEILDVVSASEEVGILDDVTNQSESEVIQLKVGMKFDTVDEMYELYRKYAQQKGFPIKIGHQRRIMKY